MKIVPVQSTEHRLARAWYIQYPLDAYALGPLRYNDPVPASTALEQAENQFDSLPVSIWPEGPVIEVEKYPITIGEVKDQCINCDKDMDEYDSDYLTCDECGEVVCKSCAKFVQHQGYEETFCPDCANMT